MNRLHIETTTRCTLTCPACPRTEWTNILGRPVGRHDLVVDDLESFLDCEGGQAIEIFDLCGDYGDTIYYPHLFELIKRFRHNKSFFIRTNGSYQPPKFWHQLNELLTAKDTIIFGIDGLEDTNHLYRRNSDWSSIMRAIDIVTTGPAKIQWQTIVFSFNQHQLKDIRDFAESKNTEFFCIKTHRYGDDSLVPHDSNYVQLDHTFQSHYTTDHNIVINPRCERERVITADGHLYPCDWIRNPRTLYKSQLWKQKQRWLEQLAISKTTYDQAVLVVKDWADYVRHNSINGSSEVDVLCKMKCRQGCSHDKQVTL